MEVASCEAVTCMVPRPGVRAVLEVPEGTPRGTGVGLSGQYNGGQKMRAWRWEYFHGVFWI